MQGRTHALTGLLIGCIITTVTEQDVLMSILIVFASLLGSLLPDIDTADSILGRRVKAIGWLSRHRGFFHSLLFLIIILVLSSPLVSRIILLSFTAGFISHLILDAMTKKGVTIIPGLLHIKGFFKTGSFAEQLLFLSGLLALLYIIIS
ncbi:MAG: metal-dependent hydrolase [Nanobdellota archaeon]